MFHLGANHTKKLNSYELLNKKKKKEMFKQLN